MSIVKRKPVAIETLAKNLEDAKTHREQQIALANADYEEQRQAVIEQGTQRARELRRLEAEARTEAENAEKLVANA